MGKRTLTQRRGRGSSVFRVPKHKFSYKSSYKPMRKGDEVVKGDIVDLIDDRIRSAPIVKVLFTDGFVAYTPAPEGISVGARVEMGADAGLSIGNILPLENIPEGTPIFNIEKIPGDGGKVVRTSGAWAVILTKDKKGAIIKMPSKKKIRFNADCRATIGNAAGGGRREKPLVKAGAAHFKYKVKNMTWPKVRGVAMNPVSHKHGGYQHHTGKSTTVSRNARPGQKVGHIAAKRTGRKKK